MIIHVPHSDPGIPADLRDHFILGDVDLAAEVVRSTDWFTDELFDGLGHEMVRFPISRLVVDPERFDDDSLEPMAPAGRGVIYRATTEGKPMRREVSDQERSALLGQFYRPHHALLTEVTRRGLATSGSVLIVDAHSFPAVPWEVEPMKHLQRPDFCLGTDPFHTPVSLVKLVSDRLAEQGYSVMENIPYAGSLVPIEFYQKDSRVASIMIEVNRRLYMDESTGAKSKRFETVKSVITNICDSISRTRL